MKLSIWILVLAGLIVLSAGAVLGLFFGKQTVSWAKDMAGKLVIKKDEPKVELKA